MEKRLDLEDEYDRGERERKEHDKKVEKWMARLVFGIVFMTMIGCFGPLFLFGIAAILWATR